jgi:hypothetical protein
MTTREKPCAICAVCGKYGSVISVIGKRCGNRHDGKRCKGVWRSAVNDGDWKECKSCDGAGGREGNPCKSCQGSGWIFSRPKTGRYFGA